MNALIALPAFNEKKYVNDLISQIKEYDLDILVIDDGSTDGTQKYLSEISDIKLITHPKNLGYGYTIIDAFKYGILAGYEYLVTMDCDGQHMPDEIPTFLDHISKYDIVSGSRYFISDEYSQNIPPDRYAINRKITEELNKMTNLNLTDSFCGFKAYKVCVLKKMNLTENGYGMPLQLWMQAWKLGLHIKEIPVRLIYNDSSKRFGGQLDNPVTRLEYYREIMISEMSRETANVVTV